MSYAQYDSILYSQFIVSIVTIFTIPIKQSLYKDICKLIVHYTLDIGHN